MPRKLSICNCQLSIVNELGDLQTHDDVIPPGRHFVSLVSFVDHHFFPPSFGGGASNSRAMPNHIMPIVPIC